MALRGTTCTIRLATCQGYYATRTHLQRVVVDDVLLSRKLRRPVFFAYTQDSVDAPPASVAARPFSELPRVSSDLHDHVQASAAQSEAAEELQREVFFVGYTWW